MVFGEDSTVQYVELLRAEMRQQKMPKRKKTHTTIQYPEV